MELVKIATGEPITREQIEAEWIAAQPATVMVPQTVSRPHIVEREDEEGNLIKETVYRDEVVEVEIDNHVGFPLPFNPSDHGVMLVEPTAPPALGPDEVAERDGVENVGGGWQYKWTIRPMTSAEKKALVPAAITARQARIVLSRHGYLPAVETALAAMPGQQGEEARIEWEYAAEFRRDHPLIAAIGAVLELNDDTIDALFIEAAAIV